MRGWNDRDFGLARRFSNGETLQSEELRRLAQCLVG